MFFPKLFPFLSFLCVGCNPSFPENTSESAAIQIEFLDIGQGNASLIHVDNNWMLVDAGPDSAGLFDTLRARNIDSLAWVFLTHNHRDHIGGLWEISGKIPIGTIFHSPDLANLYAIDSVRKLLRSTTTQFVSIARGDTLPLDAPWKSRVLWPRREDRLAENEASAVLWMGDAQGSILWMGDLGMDEERKLLQWEMNLHASILQVGHHGSATSTSLAFLGSVSPLKAVISVGENSWGHPLQETLDRLRLVLADTASIFRTDQQGTLYFSLLSGYGLLMPK